MRLVVFRIDDIDVCDRSVYEEEAEFVIPGGDRTVVLAPFAALDDLLPVLARGLDDLPEQCCDACGDAECRTLEIDGTSHEVVPEALLVRAGLIAASQLFDPTLSTPDTTRGHK